jgi:uncharacterized protein DUF4398
LKNFVIGETGMRGSERRYCVLLIVGALTACGGAQLNQSRVTEVQSAMRAAEEVGANDQPKASLHLQLARDEVVEAKRLADSGDGDNAGLLLNRAQADAELALQLARTEQEQQKARQAWSKIQELKQNQR